MFETFAKLFSAFGAGYSAVAAYGQAKTQQAALTAQSQVARNNATLSEWQAQDAESRGEDAANAARMKGAQVKGTQRAALAANGVDVRFGSAANTLTDTDYITQTDANTLANNAARAAWGYRMQGRQYLDQSSELAGGAARVNPWLSAGSSLLSSATNVASRWYNSSSTANQPAASSGALPSWATGTSGVAD